eukprot:PITA_25398
MNPLSNSVWEVVPRPADKSAVSSRWIYKVKQAKNGSVEKHKTKFVARVLSLVEGIDYKETFTPVESYFTGLGFTKSEEDVNLYHIVVEGKLLIILLYVDDLILTSDEKLIKYCKEDLVREFEMKDLGLMDYFLSMEVWKEDEELFVSHGMYANEIPTKFHMERNKPMETPLIGIWRKEYVTSGEVVEATIYRHLMGSLISLW